MQLQTDIRPGCVVFQLPSHDPPPPCWQTPGHLLWASNWLNRGPASFHCACIGSKPGEAPPSQSQTDVAVPVSVCHWPVQRASPFCWHTRGHLPFASMSFQIGPAGMSLACAAGGKSDAAAQTNTIESR